MRLEKLIDKKVAADRDLQEQQQTFIESENWLPNSPDVNPVYYSVWGRCNRWCIVAQFQILIRVQIDCWAQLSQDTLHQAIDQLPRRLMMVIKAKSAHGLC